MEEQSTVRINKYISESGVLSRRKADAAIEEGLVTIDGRVAVPGDRVPVAKDGTPLAEVRLKDMLIVPDDRKVIVLYYKPIGLTCTSKEADKTSIYHKFDYPMHLNYVGRLDKDSQGLLLMTNDGELSNMIQKSRYGHEKEYIVRVDKNIDSDFLKAMSSGVPILDTVTKKCTVRRKSDRTFYIVLTEGLNRQIRRMCEALGYKVTYLKRIRELNITLGDLKPGEYRELTVKEEKELRRLVMDGRS